MLILIFLGALFGPMLGVFDSEAVSGLAPYIAALALTYILFDGGIGLNIKRVLFSGPKAVLLALLSFVFSVLGIAAFMTLVFQMPLIYGLLFGSIFGGSSSIVVISLTSKIKISEKGATILILESAITDILCIVISLSIINIIVTGQADIGAISSGIVGKFAIGLGVGIAAGFAWLLALKKLSTLSFSYILTLGVVLGGYAISELLGGSGALSVLMFGLILGNEREIIRGIKKIDPGFQNGKMGTSVSKGLKRFEAEIAFLIRTFFFVFLGIIVSISSFTILLSGIILSLIIFVTRFGAVMITTTKSSLRKEMEIMTVILTRGLAAAVLATLPAQMGLLYADLFVDLAVIVIVSTAIIATVGTVIICRSKQCLPFLRLFMRNHNGNQKEEQVNNKNNKNH